MATKKNDYVRFTDLHDKMVQVVTKLITKTEFKKWVSENVTVREYLPIISKYAIISIFARTFKNKAFNQSNSDETNLDLVYLEYDLSMVFDLLFSYTNIVILPDDKVSKNYDLIKQSGFYDIINGICHNDYVEMIEKCDRLTGIYDVSIMSELLNIFNNYPKVEEIEKMRDILNNEVDSDKLKALQNIEAYNNPTMEKLIDSINDESVLEKMNKNE